MSLPPLAQLESLDMDHLIATAREAGEAIMNVYSQDFEVASKADRSPITQADLRAHHLIVGRLKEKYPAVPVLSEENVQHAPYEVRKEWKALWLVDPLDGTKEFIKRNGQFTVNIGLVADGRPVAGVVFAPALGVLYYADLSRGAFKAEEQAEPVRLGAPASRPRDRIVIAGSLSHPRPEMQEFIAEQRRKYKEVEFIAMGSSMKICMVADGQVDVYPRFGPTMEWDTAAAHAVANAAGRRVVRYGTDEELRYNKHSLKNDWFLVS